MEEQALSCIKEVIWRSRKQLFKNLNPGALGFHLSFQETVKASKIGGFKGVDIDIIEMENILKSKTIDDVKRSIETSGLKFGGWSLPVKYREDEETYRRDLEKLHKYAQIAEELGCNRVFTWIVPFSDELPFDKNFEFHTKRLKPVAEILQDYDCHLGLEFVGTKTVRINHKYEFIYTLEGILRLCEAIGTKNLGLLLDSWHWYTTHGTLDQLRKLKSEQVVYVHINDAPSGIPVEEQIDNIRCLPGETGVIDLIGFLKVLKRIGYDGPVTPEPFSKKLREMPVLDAIKLTGQFLDKVWRKVN